MLFPIRYPFYCNRFLFSIYHRTAAIDINYLKWKIFKKTSTININGKTMSCHRLINASCDATRVCRSSLIWIWICKWEFYSLKLTSIKIVALNGKWLTAIKSHFIFRTWLQMSKREWIILLFQNNTGNRYFPEFLIFKVKFISKTFHLVSTFLGSW